MSRSIAVAVEPIALQVFCDECAGAVTIQMSDWPSVFNLDGSPAEDDYPAPTLAEWFCPCCQLVNSSEFPGRLAWATGGHEPARTGRSGGAAALLIGSLGFTPLVEDRRAAMRWSR